MSTYNKEEVKNLADKVYDLLAGLRDGIGTEDINNITSALMAAPAATNELRDDWDAATAHIVSQLADRFGDDRVNPPVIP